VATTPLAFHAGSEVRMLGFQRFVERSRPLIAAIRAYDGVHGHPPETLDALVPEFLPEIPETGVGSSPAYGYASLVQDEPAGEGSDRWMLVEDADEHYARAVRASSQIVMDIEDQDYGGRGYSCRDPEGHLWNFGTYDPWAAS
jgi:hypothetical protein